VPTAHRGRLYAGIALTSSATMMLEVTLTRIFAVSEWYHFAFLSVSVALLGYGISGTILALLPRQARPRLPLYLGVAFPASILACYLLINSVPFDSYQLAWDRRQVLYLAIYYLSLVVPFAAGGLIASLYLSIMPERTGPLYAANLIGSALGSMASLGALSVVGAERTIAATTALAALGMTLILVATALPRWRWAVAGPLALALACVGLVWRPPPGMALRLSPYKTLSYALQIPDARLAYQKWNAYSRIDVVESERLHSAPGLSLRFEGRLPPQHGLTVDGANLSPISRRTSPADEAYLDYLSSSLAYRLRPEASALILRPRGGVDVAVALHLGASRVMAVEDNPLIVEVIRDRYAEFTGHLYSDPSVTTSTEDPRSALQRTGQQFDVVQFSLADTYHPLASGTYSLAENHLLTVEAMTLALQRLKPDGLLVCTRWLQDPPSESLRAGALVVEALEGLGVEDPGRHLIALRSWSTMTLLASPSPFSEGDIHLIREACRSLSCDLVHYPGMEPGQANRYNLLPQPVYYSAFRDLLSSPDRRAFYRSQMYDVSPPTDDRPFFGHYFRWQQVPQIMAQLGKTWQPFGGIGFLLVVAALVGAILGTALLVLLPLIWEPRGHSQAPHRWRYLAYFGALGLGYLLVEMPLMQHFILYLGQPTLAFAVVLSALLLSSGLGSLLASRVRLRAALPVLILLIAIYPTLLHGLLARSLHLSLLARIAIAAASLVPLGTLMGMPFPGGLRRVGETTPSLIPWVWAINGSTSVIGSIMATVVALSGGYRLVLRLGAGCYLAAALTFWGLAGGGRARNRLDEAKALGRIACAQ